MTLSPMWAGFIKGLLGVLILSAVSYLGDAAHLTGILNPVLATVMAGLFSGLESSMKSDTNGTKALFGAVSVKK
jgi:hypothetical protein